MSPLKKTLTSSFTLQYTVGPAMVILYKLSLHWFDHPSAHRFTWIETMIPVFTPFLIIPISNFRLFSGRISLEKWSWYAFAAAFIMSISITFSVIRTGGPAGFAALMIVGGVTPFVGVMGRFRLALIVFSFIPTYLITVQFAGLEEKPDMLDRVWLSVMTSLCGIAILTRSRIEQSRTDRIAELRRRAGKAARDVAEEKKKSDKLLLNILPAEIAEELKARNQVKPVGFESASVLFTDFKGFTAIAEALSPEELVGELDQCFSYFDAVVSRNNLEKLKTIGDSFMCAGGVPVQNQSHALDCCLAALEIQSFMQEMKVIREKQGLPYWQLRLGIHSGPLVAGVIGEKKFSYDVWGDTVNTASRAESSGEVGRINITSGTYDLVKDYFDCTFRGSVPAKNKGSIDMYFVDRIKAIHCQDDQGRVPGPIMRAKLETLRAQTT
ncbi:MAG: adenylate/guanylate cyclase domain-containing protein [Leptospiraceae bacterium]